MTMGMTVKAIVAACQQRSERDPEQDRAHAYGYVAQHVEERLTITRVQLARDLVQWINVHEHSAEKERRSRSMGLEISKGFVAKTLGDNDEVKACSA